MPSGCYDPLPIEENYLSKSDVGQVALKPSTLHYRLQENADCVNSCRQSNLLHALEHQETDCLARLLQSTQPGRAATNGGPPGFQHTHNSQRRSNAADERCPKVCGMPRQVWSENPNLMDCSIDARRRHERRKVLSLQCSAYFNRLNLVTTTTADRLNSVCKVDSIVIHTPRPSDCNFNKYASDRAAKCETRTGRNWHL